MRHKRTEVLISIRIFRVSRHSSLIKMLPRLERPVRTKGQAQKVIRRIYFGVAWVERAVIPRIISVLSVTVRISSPCNPFRHHRSVFQSGRFVRRPQLQHRLIVTKMPNPPCPIHPHRRATREQRPNRKKRHQRPEFSSQRCHPSNYPAPE